MNIVGLLGAVGGIIDKVIPDPVKAMEIKAKMLEASYNSQSELYRAAGEIVTAEAKGESWMQRNWRPITMLIFVFIIANNYIIAPYVEFMTSLFGSSITIPTLEIPQGLWTLLQIGIGGYIGSRGMEKVVENVQKGGTPLIGGKVPKDTVTRNDLKADREELLKELRPVFEGR